MDISNINGISTGDIKSFFNNTSLTKTDKTDSFSDDFLLPWEASVRQMLCLHSTFQ